MTERLNLIARLQIAFAVLMDDFRAEPDPQSKERIYRRARGTRADLIALGAVA